ncbi:MAG: S41 family peptidase, partial [Bacteroidota bacterium]
ELEPFAIALTESIYAVAKDKHLSVSLRKPATPEEGNDATAAWLNNQLEERTFYRRYNANFKSVKKLEGNVGYLELRGFYGVGRGKRFADHAMDMLATSDAIIIDLRNNSGGRGDMVNYLLSYFFAEPIIASKTLKRRGDDFIERIHYSAARVAGKRMPEVPLFVLTSNTTFSAAEGFSYPLKVYERATFVGETTMGGANPGDIVRLNNELQVFISDVSVTHPITDSSWEGIGIAPDIAVASEEALEIAIEKAREAARTFRDQNDARAREVLLQLNETVSGFTAGMDNQLIIDAYLACRHYDLIFEEWELNNLGYQLLSDDATAAAAEAVFQTNTIFYPHSANTYDSYADALERSGKLAAAAVNYAKAVKLARAGDGDNLATFEGNLKRVRAALGE